MFSVAQKRSISEAVQQILRNTQHPELPEGEIQFTLNVMGTKAWSYAIIENNGAVPNPGVNPWNEMQAAQNTIAVCNDCGASMSREDHINASHCPVRRWNAMQASRQGEKV